MSVIIALNTYVGIDLVLMSNGKKNKTLHMFLVSVVHPTLRIYCAIFWAVVSINATYRSQIFHLFFFSSQK
jgi:hypothetical protein